MVVLVDAEMIVRWNCVCICMARHGIRKAGYTPEVLHYWHSISCIITGYEYMADTSIYRRSTAIAQLVFFSFVVSKCPHAALWQ